MSVKDIKIYCVNLKRATERRLKAEEEFKRINIPYVFVSAVDGKTLSDEEILSSGYDEDVAKKLRNANQLRGLSRMEIACSLSHLRVYSQILLDKTQVALVAEDDIAFDFDRIYLDKLLMALPNDWEICFLYHRGMAKRLNRYICKFDSIPGTAVCYLLSLRGAEKLLKIGKPLRLGPDILIGRAVFNNALRGYGAFPVRVRHMDGHYSFLAGGKYKEGFLERLYHSIINNSLFIRRLKSFIKGRRGELTGLY